MVLTLNSQNLAHFALQDGNLDNGRHCICLRDQELTSVDDGTVPHLRRKGLGIDIRKRQRAARTSPIQRHGDEEIGEMSLEVSLELCVCVYLPHLHASVATLDTDQETGKRPVAGTRRSHTGYVHHYPVPETLRRRDTAHI